MEKSLEEMRKDENKGKVDESVLAQAESVKDSLKEILKNEAASKADIESKIKELNEVFAKLAAAQGTNAGANPNANTQDTKKKDDDVIDAEVVDEK